jgi:hypothetical protein
MPKTIPAAMRISMPVELSEESASGKGKSDEAQF